MARHFRWLSIIAANALLFAPSSFASERQQQGGGHDQRQGRDSRPQDPHRWKWWLNPDDRRELGITDEQSAQIDQIFESTMPAQRAKWREFEKLEEDLSKTIKDGTIDVALLTQQVDRVEKMRAELATTRTVMLYRISQVLTPQQRSKVEALRARREEARRKQSDKSDKMDR
jgi:Spy/CpxP family protein refolding chaperone